MTAPIILHTGPADRADRWLAALRAAGFEVRALPAIASEPVVMDAATRDLVAAGAPYGMIVVTSPRAAAVMAGISEWMGDAAIAAVGAATAKACADAGFAAKWVGSSSRRPFLEALAARVDLVNRSVLHPHGDLTEAPGLPELAGRGARVVAPVVYRTVAVGHAPDEVRAAALGATGVTFTSPSGVRSFAAAADAAGIGRAARAWFAATLGPSTEAAARTAGFAWRGIARRPEPEALAILVKTALNP